MMRLQLIFACNQTKTRRQMRQQAGLHHQPSGGKFEPARPVAARARESVIQRHRIVHRNNFKARLKIGALPVHLNITKPQSFERANMIVKKTRGPTPPV